MSEFKKSGSGGSSARSRATNKAVALKYDPDSSEAPVVIASGCGHSAERIIDVAEKMGIPVYRDDSAASLMCMLQVGSSIPPELYQVVAGIYCHLLEVSANLKNSYDNAQAIKTPQNSQNISQIAQRIAQRNEQRTEQRIERDNENL